MRLRASKILGPVALAAALSVGAAPAVGAAPTDPEAVTVSPGSELVDGQSVTVSYTGFPAEATLSIRQCLPNPLAGSACDFNTLVNTESDADGNGSFQYTVRTLDGSQGVPCDAARPCAIAVARLLDNFDVDAASARITFARFATRLRATPAVARILPNLRLFFPNLNARLTLASSGEPLVGRTVDFFVRTSRVCSAVTGTDGVARCQGTLPLAARVVLGFGYEARFAGDPYHAPAVARALLVLASFP